MSRLSHGLRSLAAALVAAALLGGCGADSWDRPRTGPTAVGTLAPDFVDAANLPAPEAVFTPSPGSWDGISPARGYRVVLVALGDDAPTRQLVSSVQQWADEVGADLRTLDVGHEADIIPTVTQALDLHPDLIISAGNLLVDPLAIITANHLDQQFLIVGAEVAEPTENVTAVDWAGASFRGEGLGAATTYDPASFTPERCATAVRAGVAAVLGGITGFVIWIS